jgi:Spy/CpxP family protein refolding chaperone
MRCLILTILFLLFAVAAVAQDAPSGRWWRSPRVVETLKLTGGEIQQLENAYGRSRREMINRKNRVETEQFELERMMGNPQLNEAEIRKQNRKLEKARSDLADAKFSFVIQARKILGHARFQQLVDLKSKGR